MEKQTNILINTLLLDCKKLMMERQTGMKAKTELFETIKTHSPKLYSYIQKGLDLWEYACMPEYINVFMEYELLLLLKQELTKEELQAAVLFQNLFPNAIVTENESYFNAIFGGEKIVHDLSAVQIAMHKLQNGFWDWEELFFPAFLPEGYTAIEPIEKRQLRYQNNLTKDILLFEQLLSKQDYFNKKEKTKENSTFFYCLKQYDNHIYYFSLSSTKLSKDELTKTAESIVAVNFTKNKKQK